MKRKHIISLIVVILAVCVIVITFIMRGNKRNTSNIGCVIGDSAFSDAELVNAVEAMEKEKMKRSYNEIADVLKELGIEGITEELISKLESMYADMPEEVIFDKTANLLSVLGNGTFDESSGEWIPTNHTVYSFDAEALDESRLYTDFLTGVSALGGEELDFTNIKVNLDHVDWDEGTGEQIINFEWDGKSYLLYAEVEDDWFDLNVINQLNDIIIEKDTGKRLLFTTDGYQSCIIFYNDEQWAELFREKTGLSLTVDEIKEQN